MQPSFRTIRPVEIAHYFTKTVDSVEPKNLLDRQLQRRYVIRVNQTISTCKECGAEFTPVRDWQRFCSTPCGAKARHKKYKSRVKKALKMMKKNGKAI